MKKKDRDDNLRGIFDINNPLNETLISREISKSPEGLNTINTCVEEDGYDNIFE